MWELCLDDVGGLSEATHTNTQLIWGTPNLLAWLVRRNVTRSIPQGGKGRAVNIWKLD